MRSASYSSIADVEAKMAQMYSVLDIGPGINPSLRWHTGWYMAIEPHWEYADRVAKLGYSVMQARAIEALSYVHSVDQILIIDVIEHMDKEEGKEVIRLAVERANQRVVVFTPLGFMKQSFAEGQKDPYGLEGQYWQTHRSGWEPEDFPGWDIGMNEHFHNTGEGAIFAMFNKAH